MSGTGARLRELLANAVSEVRRLARRRRVAAASTAAVCCAVVSVLAVGLAVPLAGHASSRRSVSSERAAGVPRYYIQQLTGAKGTRTRTLVRDTATGAVTATVRCPWAGAYMSGLAPADGGVFFIACQRTNKSARDLGSRIYEFRLTRTGWIPAYNLVVGNLPDLATTGLTAAANGSDIAMKTSPIRSASKATDLMVFYLRNGYHPAVWSAPQSAGRYWDLTLSSNGEYLRFLRTPHTDVLVDDLVEQVGPAIRGGLLSSARVLVHVNLWPTSFTYVGISPGGSVLTVAGYQLNFQTGTGTMIIDQMAVPTGKVIRKLFRANFAMFPKVDGKRLAPLGWGGGVSPDPSGQHLIVTYGPVNDAVNGWLDHGRLVPLAPAHGTYPGYETW